jgi:hypothetical protein
LPEIAKQFIKGHMIVAVALKFSAAIGKEFKIGVPQAAKISLFATFARRG